MVRAPERISAADGLNTTWIAHVSFFARDAGGAGQLFVCVKSPFTAMFEICTGDTPVFTSVTLCGGLIFPTCTSPNETE
jgi:hypothetical protein